MRRLELSPRDIDIIVLSHGHWDHTTGHGRARRGSSGAPSMPVLIHPEFWSRRRVALPGREPVELPTTSKSALEGAGFEIVEERQPSFLLDGSLLVTGEVDRTTEFEQRLPRSTRRTATGDWQPDPLILDDQALVAHVRGRGLVVLTGCGHSGIVNILRYVRKLTGEDRFHAVLGGFHLSGPLFEPIIAPTCDALAELAPDYLVPRTAPAGAPCTRSPRASRTRSSRTASAPASSSPRRASPRAPMARRSPRTAARA